LLAREILTKLVFESRFNQAPWGLYVVDSARSDCIARPFHLIIHAGAFEVMQNKHGVAFLIARHLAHVVSRMRSLQSIV
jgi:hypothetical protein